MCYISKFLHSQFNILHQDVLCCNVSLVIDALKWTCYFHYFHYRLLLSHFHFCFNFVIIYCTHVRMHACVCLYLEIQQNN